MAVTTINNFGNLNHSVHCVHCNYPIDASGRFCGECGAPTNRSKAQPSHGSFAASFQKTATVVPPHIPHAAAPQAPSAARPTAPVTPPPNFAKVGNRRKITPELQAELTTLVCTLARERMFLFFHCFVFLAVNSLGLFLAFTAYNGYIGDEITKTIMAMTPMMFINTIALAGLSPIKGTNREIARIKEKLKLVRSRIEYSNLY